jgi:hypothetical protein
MDTLRVCLEHVYYINPSGCMRLEPTQEVQADVIGRPLLGEIHPIWMLLFLDVSRRFFAKTLMIVEVFKGPCLPG